MISAAVAYDHEKRSLLYPLLLWDGKVVSLAKYPYKHLTEPQKFVKRLVKMVAELHEAKVFIYVLSTNNIIFKHF